MNRVEKNVYEELVESAFKKPKNIARLSALRELAYGAAGLLNSLSADRRVKRDFMLENTAAFIAETLYLADLTPVEAYGVLERARELWKRRVEGGERNG